MFVENSDQVKINFTHSHTKLVISEIRFFQSNTINEVKSVISKKFGTLPEYMKLRLLKTNGSEFLLGDNEDNQTLKHLGVENYDTIHVVDTNPFSVLVQNNIDDLSTVEKYEISEEDYNKREDNARKFRQKVLKDPNIQALIKATQTYEYEEEAKKVEVGQRCILNDGVRKGEVMYVGKAPEMGIGYWVGVKLDEPLGDSNGK